MTTQRQNTQLSTQQRLLLALKQANAKLDAVEQKRAEPIAVIGMGCRLPGGVDSPESFWQLLLRAEDVRRQVPPERWDVDEYYDPDPDTPNKIYVRQGYFLEQPVDQFDPGFFAISRVEAAQMDPSQRLMLEIAWEALEHAAIAPESLRNTATGIFVGQCFNDYQFINGAANPNHLMDFYPWTGTGLSFTAGRIAYALGLQGPTFCLDTACSSSLTTLHLACQSLRIQESNLALVGGVNLMLHPSVTHLFCRGKALSPKGRCASFDASADGYARGEGCGVVVLKRLSDAVTDGDRIWGVVRGSAINHDGPSSGLTVPNVQAQQKVIQKALKSCRLAPSAINYVECHGTGTPLGDPLEVSALAKVYCQQRSGANALTLGSVKTNIGHLEGAAGIASFIKTVLCLHHKQIPANLHFQTPNPRVNWQNIPIQIPTQVQVWPKGEHPRRAGVSSFGMSGTNAHVILEETPEVEVKAPESVPDRSERPYQILTLAAKTETALTDLINRYHSFLQEQKRLPLADICFTANTGRTPLKHRFAVATSSLQELITKLSSKQLGESGLDVSQGQVASGMVPQIGFLFTGQGAQYVGMGYELYETQPTFRNALEQCAEILQSDLDKPLLEILYPKQGEDSLLDQTAYTQPALFALEYALYQLWRSWGVQPAAVMGHSVGEYVAACVAGVFSLEDGLKLIAMRGQLMQQLSVGGVMVSLRASVAQVSAAITDRPEVAIAAINGPESTVISGPETAVQSIVAQLEAEGIKSKPLQVSHAFHSPLMQPMLTKFEQAARKVTYSPPQLQLISNVTGEMATAEVATPEYWCRHILSPVNFAAGMKTLRQQGCEVFLECGPKPILLGMGRQCLPEDVGVWLPSLRPGQSDWRQMLASLGELYVRGVNPDWVSFDRDYPQRRKVSLPTYPFQRRRCWVEPTSTLNQMEQSELSSEVLKLLQQGNTPALLQQLKSSPTFSAPLTPEKVLDCLVQLHQRQAAQTSLSDLLFRLDWQAQPSLSAASLPPGQWLLFADQSGLASAFAHHLREKGHQCHLFPLDSSPEPWERLETLLSQLTQNQALPLHGVIYLWGWNSPSDDLSESWDWETSLRQSLYPLLRLVQIISHLPGALPKLWVITRQAQAVNSSPVVVPQTPLLGLGRVIAQEHPELWGGMIDLEASHDLPQSAQQALTEIFQAEGAVQAAYRQGRRYLPRLVRLKAFTPEAQLSSESSYLISGGLGALGLRVAQRLVERGTRHLVLLGRRGVVNEDQQQEIARLKAAGAQIQVVAVDVSDWTALRQLWTDLQRSIPPVRGVIHAAGVLDDGLLQNQSWERFLKVMRPKVQGGWNLHRLTQDADLDFFICFSSVASLLGSAAQSNYAAANAFLDGLCEYRRSQGLPGLSLNWGPWAEVGMATELASGLRVRMARMGMKLMSPEQGLQVLEQQLGARGQLGVFAFDWKRLNQRLTPSEKAFFAEMLPPEATSRVQFTPETGPILQQRLKAAADGERQALLRQFLQEEVARVLGLPVTEKPDLEVGFFELGMDSLMAMELRNRLTQALGVSLPSTLTFDFPNIVKLENYIIDQHLVKVGVVKAEISNQAADSFEVDLLAEIEQASDQELESSIDQILASYS